MIIIKFNEARRERVQDTAIEFAHAWGGKLVLKTKSPCIEYDIAASDLHDEPSAVDKMVEAGLIDVEADEWEIL